MHQKFPLKGFEGTWEGEKDERKGRKKGKKLLRARGNRVNRDGETPLLCPPMSETNAIEASHNFRAQKKMQTFLYSLEH